MMPRERGITLPMIQKRDGNLTVYRLFYLRRPVPHELTIITPPFYLASCDLSRGQFLKLEKLEPNLSQLPPQPWRVEQYRFEWAGTYWHENALITASNLWPPPINWSTITNVPPMTNDWILGYTNTKVWEDVARFYSTTVNTNATVP